MVRVMLNKFQTTIANEIKFEGKGIHTGVQSKITLRPAESNTGIVFIRSDDAGSIVQFNCVKYHCACRTDWRTC